MGEAAPAASAEVGDAFNFFNLLEGRRFVAIARLVAAKPAIRPPRPPRAAALRGEHRLQDRTRMNELEPAVRSTTRTWLALFLLLVVPVGLLLLLTGVFAVLTTVGY